MSNRVVRAGILTSESVNELAWASEIFYRRLMSVADDFGRYDARPSILRANLYPLKLDRVTVADIGKWLTECVKAGLVSCYTVGGKEYLEIINFGQTVRIKRSKYPAPDGSCEHMQANASRCIAETESETETEKKDTIPAFAGDSEPGSDLKSLYSHTGKDKKSVYAFIKTHEPQFIEPYFDLWKLFAAERGLPGVRDITNSRRKKFKVRIREKQFDLPAIIKKAGASEFLMTSNWFGLDWILENDSNYLKVLEGNYDNKDEAITPDKPRLVL